MLSALAARLDATGQGLVVVTHRMAAAALCRRTLAFGVAPDRVVRAA